MLWHSRQRLAMCYVVLAIFAFISGHTLTWAGNELKSVRGLTLVDATGKKIGTVFNGLGGMHAGATTITFKIGEEVIALAAFADRFPGSFSGAYFKSCDCSGQAYIGTSGIVIPDYGPSLLPFTAIGGPGETVYVANPGASTEGFTPGSVWLNQGWECQNYCELELAPANFLPAHPLVDLSTEFTPPFRLR
jgi:hypothetical protein